MMSELTNEQKAQFVLNASQMMMSDTIECPSMGLWNMAELAVKHADKCSPYSHYFAPGIYNKFTQMMTASDIETVNNSI